MVNGMSTIVEHIECFNYFLPRLPADQVVASTAAELQRFVNNIALYVPMNIQGSRTLNCGDREHLDSRKAGFPCLPHF